MKKKGVGGFQTSHHTRDGLLMIKCITILKEKQMDKLVLVLGMHRSGTSTLTGVLYRMGLSIGDNLMKPSTHNPKGYYENMDFYGVNEKILKNCKSTWHNVDNVFNDEVLLAEDNRRILRDVLIKYEGYDIFGLKDPRVCVLLPLYEEVCNELNIEIIYIYNRREDSCIIKSIMRRDGFKKDKVEKLIEQHRMRITKKDYKVEYNNLITNTEDEVNKLSGRFEFLHTNDMEEILQFVDPTLNNGKRG